MYLVFNKRTRQIIIATTLLLSLLLLALLFKGDSKSTVTTFVERGEVSESVSVSGFVEAKSTSGMAFPVSGRVTDIFVDEGDEVKAGDVLATQAAESLVAKRAEAVAALAAAKAALQEAASGASSETRETNVSKLSNAETELERVTEEQNKLVENALRALLATGPEAISDDPKNESPAPIISGTYSCDKTGTYRINILSSSDGSGSRDYRLLGLETGNYTAYENVPTALGECGLKIELETGSALGYDGRDWLVEIPNTRSSSYTTNNNAYELALKTRDNAIQAAEDVLNLIKSEVSESNSPARTEVVNQKEAAVAEAEARVDQIDAEIKDRSIVAPFDGFITKVAIVAGETADSTPVITILKNDIFEITARVPEIDIRKIAQDQKVEMVFDAATEETLHGHVSYVPMQATEIDGVAYFETLIVLDEVPEWIRSGLNADIDIIVSKTSDILRLPRRFIKEEDGRSYVWINGDKTEIGVSFIGNNGYAAITGLSEGETVETPPAS